jgi:drug/metabolite transporter (DMT)-like permease
MTAYGFHGVFVRWTGLEGRETVIVLWRGLIGFALIVLIAVAARKTGEFRIKGKYFFLFLCGASITIQTYSGVRAINMLPLSDAVFIIYLAPVLIALFAPLVLKEKLEGRTVVALGFAIAGLAAISFIGNDVSNGSDGLKGVGFAVLSAVSYAVLVLTVKYLRDSMSSLAIFFYQSIVMIALILPFAGWRPPTLDAGQWGSLFIIGAVHSAILPMVYLVVIKRVKAQHMGVLSYVDPLSSTLFAWLLLGEVPGWENFAGGALIIAAGMIILFSSEVRKGEQLPLDAVSVSPAKLE